MEHIKIVTKNSVATLLLNREHTNPIDGEMLESLFGSLDQLKNDNSIKSVILTSSNDKIFSFGFNLPVLVQLEKPDFQEFFRSFNELCLRLYTFPKPLIASINGYAIAGGCILALCADYRIVSNSKLLMGLNEVKLGVPVPWAAMIILRELIENHLAEEVVLTGKLYSPEQLLHRGIVNEVCDHLNLESRAFQIAREMGANLNKSYQFMKVNMRQKTVDNIILDIENQNRKFVNHWFSRDTQLLLKTAAEKF